MQVSVVLCLPRDALTVPLCRHLCSTALRELGADPDVVSDIEVAVAEACTNVLDHSGEGDEYEVTIAFGPEAITIRIVDTGHGFDAAALRDTAADSDERGRGVLLMNALVDRVKFESRPTEGTIVHLEKRLAFADDSAMARLSDAAARPPR